MQRVLLELVCSGLLRIMIDIFVAIKVVSVFFFRGVFVLV